MLGQFGGSEIRVSRVRVRDLGVSENRGYLRVPLKDYYKGTIRVSLKGSIRV